MDIVRFLQIPNSFTTPVNKNMKIVITYDSYFSLGYVLLQLEQHTYSRPVHSPLGILARRKNNNNFYRVPFRSSRPS